jgi:hypothetical protein
MEPTLLQRSEQKETDGLRRIRGAMERGDSPFAEGKKAMILEFAKELGSKWRHQDARGNRPRHCGRS